MVQHVLEHAGVAVARHVLEAVAEIAVVGAGAGGHPRGDRLVELGRVDAPLLPGIAAEELLVELAADPADDHVLGGADHRHRLGAGGEEGLDLGRIEIEAVELVDGGEVDRDRHEHAVDLRQHAVLVGAPLGEAREIGRDLVRVGVEDVGPVAVDEDAVGIVLVEGVAAHMRAAVDQQHPLPGPTASRSASTLPAKPAPTIR